MKEKQTLFWDKKWHEHKYRFFFNGGYFAKTNKQTNKQTNKKLNKSDPVVILLAVTRKLFQSIKGYLSYIKRN